MISAKEKKFQIKFSSKLKVIFCNQMSQMVTTEAISLEMDCVLIGFRRTLIRRLWQDLISILDMEIGWFYAIIKNGISFISVNILQRGNQPHRGSRCRWVNLILWREPSKQQKPTRLLKKSSPKRRKRKVARFGVKRLSLSCQTD